MTKKLCFLIIFFMLIQYNQIYCLTYKNKKNNVITKSTPAPVKQTKNNNINIKAMTLVNNMNYDILKKTDTCFNTVFLNIPGLRRASAPYNTDFKNMKKIDKSIKELEKLHASYYLCISSGPGFSLGEKKYSIISNKLELIYYVKMLKELIKRYSSYEGFRGISINLSCNQIADSSYYKIMSYILYNTKKEMSSFNYIYNLPSDSFSNNYNIVPELKGDNIIVNTDITLNSIDYPGKCLQKNNETVMNKNTILNRLETLKSIQDERKLTVIISLKSPWINNSDAFLLDTSEVLKILNFNFNLCYGNSNNYYDFSKNENIMKILKRQNH